MLVWTGTELVAGDDVRDIFLKGVRSQTPVGAWAHGLLRGPFIPKAFLTQHTSK